MIVVVVLLLAALLFLLAKWMILRREVRAMAAGVRASRLGGQNRPLRVNTQDAAVTELASAINALYGEADDVRAEQLRAGNELRRNMADISHDLRTPLTSILGYLGLLAREDNSPEKRKEYLSIAVGKAETLRRMVDSLFDLARLEAGVYRFERAPLNAVDVLTEEIAAFYIPFVDAGQEPDVRLPDRLPVLADAEALRRVFANLLQNVLRHGGSEVKITADKRGNRARFCFSNRADNLTEESVGKIFERSFTGDAARGNKNTGLGLAITDQLVRRMEGEISAALEGSRLTITVAFPLIPEAVGNNSFGPGLE